LIPPTRSKVSEYATASLKPLQRAAFVLRVKRILGSSKAPAQGGPGCANAKYGAVTRDRRGNSETLSA